ncbi:TPA: hypothetical protein EYP38_03510 [Candidatus Micrarchaeota archaeon]|nr:hypothetical protein [Candidatus Micrarchaeota archaeon]
MEKKKVPQLSPLVVAGIAVAILLVIMLYSGSRFQPFLESARTTISEGSLDKNTQLMIRNGDVFVYDYMLDNASFNMTFTVSEGPGCTVLTYEEATGVEACLDVWGNDYSGMNTSLANPMLIAFKPWMLAVKNGWTWEASMNMAFEGVDKDVMDMEYTAVRTELFRGRKAYVVKISTDGVDTFSWVDADKRVLLKEMGEGYEIEMVSGLEFKD